MPTEDATGPGLRAAMAAIIERAALQSWENDSKDAPADLRTQAFQDCYAAAFAAGVGWASEQFAKRPAIFPCGCSRLKVEAGRCDVYGPTGKRR